jgi:hypothetical protein
MTGISRPLCSTTHERDSFRGGYYPQTQVHVNTFFSPGWCEADCTIGRGLIQRGAAMMDKVRLDKTVCVTVPYGDSTTGVEGGGRRSKHSHGVQGNPRSRQAGTQAPQEVASGVWLKNPAASCCVSIIIREQSPQSITTLHRPLGLVVRS